MRILRVIFISALLLLVCASAKFLYQLEIQIKQWEENIEGTTKTHISRLFDIWGEPDKIKEYERFSSLVITGNRYQKFEKHEGYEHHWSWRKESHFAGGFRPATTTQRVYDNVGGLVGIIDTPTERYQEPLSSACVIRVNTDRNGMITHVSYESQFLDGSTHPSGFKCFRPFPFP